METLCIMIYADISVTGGHTVKHFIFDIRESKFSRIHHLDQFGSTNLIW